MLDVISDSENFFKCVRNCEVSKKGTGIDHAAVRIHFMKRSIKYKTAFTKKPVIDWKFIKERGDINEEFNVNLRNQIR